MYMQHNEKKQFLCLFTFPAVCLQLHNLLKCFIFFLRYQSNLKRKTTKSQRIHPTAEKPQNQFNQFTMTKNYLMTMMGMTMTLQLQCPEGLEKLPALACVSKPWF